jgi:hypothetical protein
MLKKRKDRICTTQPKSGDKFTGFKVLNTGLEVAGPQGSIVTLVV